MSTVAKILVAITLFAAIASAERIDIVAAGDSITNGYAPRLDFSEVGNTASVTIFASGGYTSNHWVASFLSEPQLRTADAVLIMLGTNDAWVDSQAAQRFEAFQVNMRRIVSRILTLPNQAREPTARIHQPNVIVAVPIPILANSNADGRLREWYRPWILGEVASWPGVETLDLYELIQRQPNWQSLYSDGVHLWANNAAGYHWMADQWRDAVLSHQLVPEPGTALMLCPFLLLAVRICRRNRRYYS